MGHYGGEPTWCNRKALGLDSEQGAIVCANISLRDKIFILQNDGPNRPNIPRNCPGDGYTKTLTEIANYSGVRNMIAHDMFDTNDARTGVLFYVTKQREN